MKDRITRLESHLAHEELLLAIHPTNEHSLKEVARLKNLINNLKKGDRKCTLGGDVDPLEVGDMVFWRGNMYTFAKITEYRVKGMIDKKYHLYSYQISVPDAILDSLSEVQRVVDYKKRNH